MKTMLIFLGFVILIALAAIKISSNANWPVLTPVEESASVSEDTQTFSEWKAKWDKKEEKFLNSGPIILSE